MLIIIHGTYESHSALKKTQDAQIHGDLYEQWLKSNFQLQKWCNQHKSWKHKM